MAIQAFPDLSGQAPRNAAFYALDPETYCGADDSREKIGRGPTPEAAIADLKAQMDD